MPTQCICFAPARPAVAPYQLIPNSDEPVVRESLRSPQPARRVRYLTDPDTPGLGGGVGRGLGVVLGLGEGLGLGVGVALPEAVAVAVGVGGGCVGVGVDGW